MKIWMRTLLLLTALSIILTGCAAVGEGGDTTDPDVEQTSDGESESATETDGESESETECETEAETKPKVINYYVVYPEGSDRFVSQLASRIKDEINAKSTRNVFTKSDARMTSEYEILLGHTNRPESTIGASDAGSAGWWVSAFGNKIVVNAASRQGLLDAVEHFLKHYTVEENGAVRIPEDQHRMQYAHDELYTKGVSLRVGSYNIMHGGQVGLDMSVLAKDIKALSLDVVGLQEVDDRTLRVGGRDTLAELAESAGYEHYFFCKAIDYQGGGYGTAILSHYPIKSFEIIPLYTWDGMEGRAVGHAVLDVNGTEVDYYNTHLSYEEESVQQKQFLELNELVKDKTCFVITADFNTDEDRFYDRIEHSIRANHRKYNTFPGNSSAIDDIVLSYGWSVVAIGREVSSHSDHYLLWAEIRLDGGVTPGT